VQGIVNRGRCGLLLALAMNVAGTVGFTAPSPLLLSSRGGPGVSRPQPRSAVSASGAARRRGAPACKMGAWEVVNSVPWALLPGTVAAGILVREGGFSSIGVFIDETFDYLEQKGGYIITEVERKTETCVCGSSHCEIDL
jgi:hypothetical protein